MPRADAPSARVRSAVQSSSPTQPIALASADITARVGKLVTALDELCSRHPQLDRSRVGIRGWSFGGYFAAMAVLLRPDVFHAAIAGAPVTDWALYDTAYTERYMKQPAANPAGYAATSALTSAPVSSWL